MVQEQSKLQNHFFHLLSGGLAGALSRSATAPIERTVILRQTQNHMYKTEGVFSFFKGNGVNCLRIAPFQAIEFFAYDKYKIAFDFLFKNHENSKLKYFFCGILSGMTASTIVYPLDLMKTIFAFQQNNQQYNGVKNTFFKIINEKGFFGLYRGWTLTMCGIGPYAGVKLSTYNILKNYFNHDNQRGDFTNLMIGSFSGCFAVTITYPTDLVRKQIHVQLVSGQKKSVFQVVQQLYNTKGIQGFYMGLGLTYLKILPSTGLAFALNDKFKKLFRVNTNQ